MQNVNVKKSGNILTIEVDLTKNYGPSGSGKSIIVATSAGIVPIEGTDIKFGLNVFKPVK
jgi:ABC-type cobalamin transport system ATPase subunit